MSAAEYAFPYDAILSPGSGMLLDFYGLNQGVYGQTSNQLAAVMFEELRGSASG
jgi:hypothetical protein